MLIPMLRDVHQVTVKVCLYAYLHTISLTPPEVEIEVEVQYEKLCTTDVHHVIKSLFIPLHLVNPYVNSNFSKKNDFLIEIFFAGDSV